MTLNPSRQPSAQLEFTYPIQYEKAKEGQGVSPPPFVSSVHATAATTGDGMGNGNMAESIYFDAEDDEQGASMMMQSAPLVDQLHGKRSSRYVLLVMAHMTPNPKTHNSKPKTPNPS